MEPITCKEIHHQLQVMSDTLVYMRKQLELVVRDFDDKTLIHAATLVHERVMQSPTDECEINLGDNDFIAGYTCFTLSYQWIDRLIAQLHTNYPDLQCRRSEPNQQFSYKITCRRAVEQ